MPAGINADYPTVGRDERVDDAGEDPVGVGVGHESVVQEHRRRGAGRAPFVVGDLNAVE
jgi:hypothetical protein